MLEYVFILQHEPGFCLALIFDQCIALDTSQSSIAKRQISESNGEHKAVVGPALT